MGGTQASSDSFILGFYGAVQILLVVLDAPVCFRAPAMFCMCVVRGASAGANPLAGWISFPKVKRVDRGCG